MQFLIQFGEFLFSHMTVALVLVLSCRLTKMLIVVWSCLTAEGVCPCTRRVSMIYLYIVSAMSLRGFHRILTPSSLWSRYLCRVVLNLVAFSLSLVILVIGRFW